MHHRQWAPGQPFQRLKWQPNADVHVTLVDLRKAIRCTNEAVETQRDLAALVEALSDRESQGRFAMTLIRSLLFEVYFFASICFFALLCALFSFLTYPKRTLVELEGDLLVNQLESVK